MTSLLILAALCASGGDPAEPGSQEDSSSDLEPFVALRSGVWAGTGFHFEAIKDSIKREIETNALFSIGVDAGVRLLDHFVLFGTYEVNLAEDIFSDLAGVCVGYRERAVEGGKPTIPVETTIYAGGIYGRFEVDAADGLYDFDDAFGFRAGIAFSWRAGRSLTVDLVGEYRLIEFDSRIKEDSGDDQIGGSSGWLGLGLNYRF